MNKFRLTLKLLVIAAFVLAFTSLAQAQATRTWVSGVGDDVNPCSRTAPCKTFAGAISKTAAGGEIDCLDPGGFGAVTITKSMTIDGTTGAGFGSILASGTNGVNVNDSATGTPGTIVVYLKNLSINGAGTTPGLRGVNITSGRTVWVENCQIFGFKTSPGVGIIDSRTLATSPAGQLFVTGTSFFNNTVAIQVGTAAGAFLRAFITNCKIFANSTHGVQANNSAIAHVRGCDIGGNSGDAVRAEGSATINVISSQLNGNLNGANNVSGTINLADVTIMNNGNGVAGNPVVTFGNNNVRNNGGGNTLPGSVGQQ